MSAGEPYGAFELKRCYQKHLGAGALITGAATALALLVITLLGGDALSDDPYPAVPLPPDGVIIDWDRPPIVVPDNPPPVRPPSPPKPESRGTFKPVADYADAPDDQPADSYAENPWDGGTVPDAQTGGFGQSPGASFVFKADSTYEIPDVPPRMALVVKPEYPRLARSAGIEATVWVKVLVDTDGAALDVRVESCDQDGYGFAEAAVAAARRCVFSPALIQNQPVRVWTRFPFEFRLRH